MDMLLPALPARRPVPRSRSRSIRAPSAASGCAIWRRWASTASASASRTSTPTCRRPCTACSPSRACSTWWPRRARCGFESINVDLIYGLPQQTPDSFRRTIAQVAELRPTRIALYAYAHLPQRFKPQRRIDAAALPSAEAADPDAARALAGFMGHGYVYIGMDHFALPDDALAVAKRQGRLHRNFQGYSTQPDCDLIALGVSAIGRIGATYSQNAKTLPEYYDALAQGRFPGRARAGAQPRRPAAPRGDHGADVPGPGRVRVDRAGAPDQRSRVLRRRARATGAAGRHGPGRARRRRRSRSPPPAGTSCARWRWSSTATCRPTACGSASRASSEGGLRPHRQRHLARAWPARRIAR